MSGRPKVRTLPWSDIKADYRTGAYSNVALARLYDCAEAAIRRRAKAEGWSKDLLGKTREEARRKLVAEDQGISDDAAIAKGSDKMVHIVRQHQRQFSKLAELTELMTDHALKLARGKAPVIANALGPRESLADAAVKISQAISRFVPLERKSHGIDDASAGEDLASWLKAQSDLD